jgi:hypothetical protein
MQSVDCIMHATANASEPVAAIAVLYNPTLTTRQVLLI